MILVSTRIMLWRCPKWCQFAHDLLLETDLVLTALTWSKTLLSISWIELCGILDFLVWQMASQLAAFFMEYKW